MVKAQNRAEVSRRVRDRIGELGRSGISQANIAKRLGLNTRTVERWRSGEVVPTQANRNRLYALNRRLVWPRDITSRVVKKVVVNGVISPPPLFKIPVSTGRVPKYWKRLKVYRAYVVINAEVEFADGNKQFITSTLGNKGQLPPNSRLDSRLKFDGVSGEWLEQINKVNDSQRILNYTVTKAEIKLVGEEIKW
jgi:transcriptional regulator with XRE-family HTH domain